MLVLLSLYQDSDKYLKYFLERIDLRHYSIQQYCTWYHNKVILFCGAAYLNRELISSNHRLTNFHPKIVIDDHMLNRITSIPNLCTALDFNFNIHNIDAASAQLDRDWIGYLPICDHTYYLFETTGTNFEIHGLV